MTAGSPANSAAATSRRPAVRHAPEDLPEARGVVLLCSQVKQGHSVVSGLTGAPRMLECGLRCAAKRSQGVRWQEDSSPPAALRQGWKNKVKTQTVNTALFPGTSRRVAALHSKQQQPDTAGEPTSHPVAEAGRCTSLWELISTFPAACTSHMTSAIFIYRRSFKLEPDVSTAVCAVTTSCFHRSTPVCSVLRWSHAGRKMPHRDHGGQARSRGPSGRLPPAPPAPRAILNP